MVNAICAEFSIDFMTCQRIGLPAAVAVVMSNQQVKQALASGNLGELKALVLRWVVLGSAW